MVSACVAQPRVAVRAQFVGYPARRTLVDDRRQALAELEGALHIGRPQAVELLLCSIRRVDLQDHPPIIALSHSEWLSKSSSTPIFLTVDPHKGGMQR